MFPSTFSVKDPVPFDLRSRVVYKFLCAGCNACYIGETSRHLSTRVRKHLSRDRNSHVYQHLQQSQACCFLANKNCFSIVDYAPLLAGLISRQAGLFWKLSLWSLSVIKACRSAIRSARSAMFRLVAMSLASLLIVMIVLVLAFL